MRPPGGGGRPGGPGGAVNDPNPPPFGANTDGKQKQKLEAFFTAAFMEQKAFFTIASRLEKGKLMGTLMWHDYQSFTERARFRLPHLATRAVIDPAQGLLYVATTSNTPQPFVAQQQYDLASAVGDIQIFELNPIIEGTTPANAEIKPLATIPVGKTIRGLELSNDGKVLFVATATTTKPTASALLKIDTETRKAVGTPKALPEPVWEMRKSADGKSLLILDAAPHVAGKTAMIRVLNSETLTEDKVPTSIQAAANHIASAPSSEKGEVAITVAGSGPGIPSKLLMVSNSGPQDVQLGIGWKAAVNGSLPGYVEYSPDGKLLFVSAYKAMGLDVYEVSSDPSSQLTILKKKASIRTAGGQPVGGHFFISPDGLYLIDHHGIVIETANVGGSNGEALNAGGVPGAPGRPGGPGFPGGGPAVAPGGPGGPGAAPGTPGTPGSPSRPPGKLPGPGSPPGAVPPPPPGGAVPPPPPGGAPMPPPPGMPPP
jgi:hypothetical protein